jgi:predicted transcriptional regulator of viral defense system
MHTREYDQKLYDVAESQLGYFTADQARQAGVHPVRLIQLAKAGHIERASRGVYRLARFPLSPLGQYMEATLWPQVRRPGVRAVLSHESALRLYELSDVSPAKVHITLPPSLRIRRTTPPHLVIHHADLAPTDISVVEGVPVTTAERTIRDVHAAHLGDALVRQAVADARRSGQLTYKQADRLERELWGDGDVRVSSATAVQAGTGRERP